ncbi:MAG: hypothetical protein VZR27_11105 [Acutalibacteraceae bacterium]|nr:hypothetical protein [Acutalibacteraceae bacterium]
MRSDVKNIYTAICVLIGVLISGTINKDITRNSLYVTLNKNYMIENRSGDFD